MREFYLFFFNYSWHLQDVFCMLWMSKICLVNTLRSFGFEKYEKRDRMKKNAEEYFKKSAAILARDVFYMSLKVKVRKMKNEERKERKKYRSDIFTVRFGYVY